MSTQRINVYGAGLAGCEAAWQAANRGVKVKLFEMKPHKMTPAHHSNGFAELVCSNSLRSDCVSNAVGLLKEEMRRFDSLVMQAADATRVPAGSALAVDRTKFSQYITDRIRNHPNIEVVEAEVSSLEEGVITVIATGPLTSDAMAEFITGELGCGKLHFFDAAAPIVDAATINMDVAFFASRYGKGDADYINCPMNKEQYDAFWQALTTAEEAQLKEFDKESQKNVKVFEGCMPVEVMAKRGYDTLRYGPLKPVGLIDPRVGEEFYAVVQLRKENREGTMFNLVGFQTHLTFEAQRRVFRMIPGLESAEFLRYGVMHRNTYINSPKLLNSDYSLVSNGNIYFAGQMTGVEGYIESCSSGWLAGFNAARKMKGLSPFTPDNRCAIGALANYVSDRTVTAFQPMNVNFGIIASPDKKIKGGKAVRNEYLSERALSYLKEIYENLE